MKQPSPFTLVEVLSALVIIAIVLPVAMRGLQTANRAGRASAAAETAAQLGNNLLVEWIQTNEWKSQNTEGDFGENYPGYRWELQTEAWSTDLMLQVLSLTIYYTVQGTELEIQLSALAPLEDGEA